jgi:hypothetical protein
MLLAAISWMKFFAAISFLCILVPGDHLSLQMGFILLIGLWSVVAGDLIGFIISVSGLLSVGFLVFSVLVDSRKINFLLSTICVALLTIIAVSTLLERKHLYPGYSMVSYVIFFWLALGYYTGCLTRGYQIYFSKK